MKTTRNSRLARRRSEPCTACTAVRFCPVHAGDALRGAKKLRDSLHARRCPSCGCGGFLPCAIVLSPATADAPAEVGQCVPAGVLGLKECSACGRFRELGRPLVLVVALVALALVAACGGAAFGVGELDAGEGGALEDVADVADASPRTSRDGAALDSGDASPRSSHDAAASPVDAGDAGGRERDAGGREGGSLEAGDPCDVDASSAACRQELLAGTCGGHPGQACLAQNDGGAFVGAVACTAQGDFTCGGGTCLDGCAVGQACSYSVGEVLDGTVYDCP